MSEKTSHRDSERVGNEEKGDEKINGNATQSESHPPRG